MWETQVCWLCASVSGSRARRYSLGHTAPPKPPWELSEMRCALGVHNLHLVWESPCKKDKINHHTVFNISYMLKRYIGLNNTEGAKKMYTHFKKEEKY